MWRRIWRWCVEGAHKQIVVFGIECSGCVLIIFRPIVSRGKIVASNSFDESFLHINSTVVTSK